MNTRDFEYLVAVAEELHFGRAAERCNASQPALSGQLRKLEERLGVQLFERTKRHVRVTEIGHQIVERAREVLREVEAMEKIASAYKDPLVGRCVLGMPPTIGPYLTPRLLQAMKTYLPGVRLELVEDFNLANARANDLSGFFVHLFRSVDRVLDHPQLIGHLITS